MATLIETKLKQERLLRIIEDELQDLPPLPAVIMRVMQTINDPTTSASDLNRLISTDQALASKVLRLVNSSYYGFPRKISTIHQCRRYPGLQYCSQLDHLARRL